MRSVRGLSYLFLFVGLVGCATDKSPTSQPENRVNEVLLSESSVEPPHVEPVKIGGWAPEFFTSFNKKELQEIVDGLQSGRISRVTISYPTQMKKLANQIHDYLQTATKNDVAMDGYELTNTETVTYNMSQVVVTMYFGN